MRMRSLTRTSLVAAIGRSSSQYGDGCRRRGWPGRKERGRTMRSLASCARRQCLPPRSRRESLFENPGSLAPRGEKPAAPASCCRGSLLPRPGLGNHFLHELLGLEGSLAPLVPAPERDGPLLHLPLPEHEHVRDLEQLRVADLGADLLLAQ